MDRIFKYAVLMAIPDPSRGERVNVGLVVLREDALDVRFAELSKIRALVGGNWNDYADDVKRRLLERFEAGAEAENVFSKLSRLDPVIQFSDLGWFAADTIEKYEDRVAEILAALVIKRKSESSQKTTRINTEISARLRRSKVLAKRTESIEDHKVVPNFWISKDEELTADFALKNGKMHVAATLDLRKAHTRIDEAALKAIVLDKANQIYDGNVCCLGVYAAPIGAAQFKAHIELLSDYSDKTYNWLNAVDQRALILEFEEAAAPPFIFGGI